MLNTLFIFIIYTYHKHIHSNLPPIYDNVRAVAVDGKHYHTTAFFTAFTFTVHTTPNQRTTHTQPLRFKSNPHRRRTANIQILQPPMTTLHVTNMVDYFSNMALWKKNALIANTIYTYRRHTHSNLPPIYDNVPAAAGRRP